MNEYCFFLTGVVLMEIAEAHKKVHSELEENVSHFKIYLDALFLLKRKKSVQNSSTISSHLTSRL